MTEGLATSLKRLRPGDTLPKTARAKAVTRYAEEFHDAGMNREFANAVWACYRADGTSLEVFFFVRALCFWSENR